MIDELNNLLYLNQSMMAGIVITLYSLGKWIAIETLNLPNYIKHIYTSES